MNTISFDDKFFYKKSLIGRFLILPLNSGSVKVGIIMDVSFLPNTVNQLICLRIYSFKNNSFFEKIYYQSFIDSLINLNKNYIQKGIGIEII